MPVAVPMFHDPVELLDEIESGALETRAAERLYKQADRRRQKIRELEAKYYPREAVTVLQPAEVKEAANRLSDRSKRDELVRQIEREMYKPLPGREIPKRVNPKVVAKHQHDMPMKRRAETLRQLAARSANVPVAEKPEQVRARELKFRPAVKVAHPDDRRILLTSELPPGSAGALQRNARPGSPRGEGAQLSQEERQAYYERLSKPRSVHPKVEVEPTGFCVFNKFRAASPPGAHRR